MFKLIRSIKVPKRSFGSQKKKEVYDWRKDPTKNIYFTVGCDEQFEKDYENIPTPYQCEPIPFYSRTGNFNNYGNPNVVENFEAIRLKLPDRH